MTGRTPVTTTKRTAKSLTPVVLIKQDGYELLIRATSNNYAANAWISPLRAIALRSK